MKRINTACCIVMTWATACAFTYPGDYAPDATPSPCGNGRLDDGEACDSALVGDETCATRGFAGGTLACSGSCTFDVTGCEGQPVPAPVPRLPMNDDHVGTIHAAGTIQPSFTWEPSVWNGPGTVTYELQLSTSSTFASDVAMFQGSTTSYRPAEDLAVREIPPVGTRYYWRVRACVDAQCSPYSRTRWVNLGRSAKDLNGDGYADVAIASRGLSGGGRVYVYYGRATPPGPLTGSPAGVIDDVGGRNLGASLAITPDLNGDGFADLVAGAPGGDAREGRAFVYFGSAGTTFNVSPDGIIVGEPGAELGSAVAAAGDVNADGYADLLVGTNPRGVPPGTNATAYVLHGGAGGSFEAQPDASLTGPAADGFSRGLASGDMNGDGYADVVVSAIPQVEGTRATFVYLGGSGGIEEIASTVLGGPGGAMSVPGNAIGRAGDVNGDGFADFLVQGITNIDVRVYIYRGAPSLPGITVPSGSIARGFGEGFGDTLACAGDVNRDGYDDIVVGAWTRSSGSSTRNGGAYIYYGRADTTDLTVSGTLHGTADFDEFGRAVAGAGDVNGDGFDDILIGAPATAGQAMLFLGSAGTAFDDTADATVDATGPLERLGLALD